MAIYSSRMVFSFGTNRNMLQHIGIRFPFLYSLLPLNEYSVAKNKKRASLDSSLHQINKAYEKEVFPSRGYTFLTQATFCLLYASDKKNPNYHFRHKEVAIAQSSFHSIFCLLSSCNKNLFITILRICVRLKEKIESAFYFLERVVYFKGFENRVGKGVLPTDKLSDYGLWNGFCHGVYEII